MQVNLAQLRATAHESSSTVIIKTYRWNGKRQKVRWIYKRVLLMCAPELIISSESFPEHWGPARNDYPHSYWATWMNNLCCFKGSEAISAWFSYEVAGFGLRIASLLGVNNHYLVQSRPLQSPVAPRKLLQGVCTEIPKRNAPWVVFDTLAQKKRGNRRCWTVVTSHFTRAPVVPLRICLPCHIIVLVYLKLVRVVGRCLHESPPLEFGFQDCRRNKFNTGGHYPLIICAEIVYVRRSDSTEIAGSL